MLPVREILGSANCLAQRETAIAALKCVYVCAHFISCIRQEKLYCIYAGGKLKSVYGFYSLMTSLCCLSVSAGDLSSSACSHRPGSWFTAALSGVVMP